MTIPITLPTWMQKPKRTYITRSGGQYRPEEVALAFALSIRFHNSADEIRATARRLVDKVCLEHQPNLKRLGREPEDAKVFDAALKIVDRVCDLMGYSVGEEFKRHVD